MPTVTTRSGRKIKKPENFVPTEHNVEDDFGDDEHDSEFDSDIDTSDEDDFSSEDDERDYGFKRVGEATIKKVWAGQYGPDLQ